MSADVVAGLELASLESVAGSRSHTVVTLANAPMGGLVQGEFHREFGRRAAELAGLDLRAFTSFTVQRFSLVRTANFTYHRD